MNRLLTYIPLHRFLLYSLLLCLVPFVFVAIHFFTEKKRYNFLRERIESMRECALTKERREATNWAVYYKYANADHFYIDKNLESIPLLEKEMKELQNIVKDKNFANDSRINTRLQYLLGKENRISFVEGVVQTHPLFQETLETFAHPVEVDVHDIQTILSRIEGYTIGVSEPLSASPQLLITDWKMDRKTIYENHEVFTLQCKLIKREFL